MYLFFLYFFINKYYFISFFNIIKLIKGFFINIFYFIEYILLFVFSSYFFYFLVLYKYKIKEKLIFKKKLDASNFIKEKVHLIKKKEKKKTSRIEIFLKK